MIAAVSLTWQTLVAAVILILVVGLVAIIWLTRDPRMHRVRFGVFLERDSEEHHSVGRSAVDPLAPTVVRPDGEADVEGE